MRLTVFHAVVLGLLIGSLLMPGAEFLALSQSQPQQKPEQQPPKQEKPPEYAISVDVPIVNVDVVATDNYGNPISGLRRENFRILEDGSPQTITNFAATDAPITIVLLLEFSKLGYQVFASNATYWAYDFMNQLNKDDWVALVTYDLKTRVEVDFTRDKQEVRQAVSHLIWPGFSEANLFDAVNETVDRLQDVKGKKAILLLASGFDTFSKHNLSQVINRLHQTDVTIFSVGVGRDFMEWLDSHGYLSGMNRVDYYQAENQLNSFARITGGRAWFPRFDGEIPGIFREVAASLRNQYSLGYVPTNRNRDGKLRKIKVELVAPDGNPLVVTDQKGKKVKYVVYAREGYVIPKAGVGD